MRSLQVPLSIVTLVVSLLARDAAACAPTWVQSTVRSLVTWKTPVTADFNGDGQTDLAGISDTEIAVALTTGGTLGPVVVVRQETRLTDLVSADVQNDGKADLVSLDSGTNTITALAGKGDGTFSYLGSRQLPFTANRMLVFDFTGDGKVDVAVRSETAATVGIWKGNGSGAFTELARTPVAVYDSRFDAADFDGDGFTDLIVPMTSPRVDVWFGNGDGTFDAPLQLTGGNVPLDVSVADVDADGDPDFAMSNRMDESMTVFRNTGSRTFVVETYDLRGGASYGPLTSRMLLADVTQDGYPDAIVSQPRYDRLATLVNNGNGTFRAPIFAYVPDNDSSADRSIDDIVAGEFTGDDRKDIVPADFGAWVALYPNNCGESTVTATIIHPLVSVGQEAPILVRVAAPGGGPAPGVSLAPSATGTVRVLEGATELAEAQLDQDGYARLMISGLTAGEHVLTARYDGDEVYDPRSSSPVTQRVTTETTTVTLEVTPAGGTSEFGQGITINPEVTASDGGSPAGGFRFFLDGKESGTYAPFYHSNALPGTYRYRVEYRGSTDHPPSTSAVYEHVVTRSPVEERTPQADDPLFRSGSVVVSLTLDGVHRSGPGPTGTVSIFEGTFPYGTTALVDNSATFSLPDLPPGTHYLHFTYSGDAHYLPYRSQLFRVTVWPSGSLVLDASASGSGVLVRWRYDAWGGTHKLQRRVNNTWQDVVTIQPYEGSGTYTEPAPPAGEPTIWRVQAYDPSNVLLATSNVDMAMVRTFSDERLATGATKIRAAHVTELVQAINAFRAATALSAISLPNAAPGKAMNALDVQTLRNALNEARASIGMASYPFRETLTARQTLIRAMHLQELRDVLR